MLTFCLSTLFYESVRNYIDGKTSIEIPISYFKVYTDINDNLYNCKNMTFPFYINSTSRLVHATLSLLRRILIPLNVNNCHWILLVNAHDCIYDNTQL